MASSRKGVPKLPTNNFDIMGHVLNICSVIGKSTTQNFIETEKGFADVKEWLKTSVAQTLNDFEEGKGNLNLKSFKVPKTPAKKTTKRILGNSHSSATKVLQDSYTKKAPVVLSNESIQSGTPLQLSSDSEETCEVENKDNITIAPIDNTNVRRSKRLTQKTSLNYENCGSSPKASTLKKPTSSNLNISKTSRLSSKRSQKSRASNTLDSSGDETNEISSLHKDQFAKPPAVPSIMEVCEEESPVKATSPRRMSRRESSKLMPKIETEVDKQTRKSQKSSTGRSKRSSSVPLVEESTKKSKLSRNSKDGKNIESLEESENQEVLLTNEEPAKKSTTPISVYSGEQFLTECQVNITKLEEPYTMNPVSVNYVPAKDILKHIIPEATPLVARCGSPYQLRRSLKPLLSSVSPKSPRQLFSPYLKQSVKSKAKVFEDINQTPVNSQIKKLIPQTVVICKGVPSPLRELNENVCPSPRKSLKKANEVSQNLILAKYDRMPLSKRRSSIVRLSMHAVKNQIVREVLQKRKSMLNEDKSPIPETKVAKPAEEDDDDYVSDSSDEEVKNRKPLKGFKSSKRLSTTNKFTKKKSSTGLSAKAVYPGSENRKPVLSRVAHLNSFANQMRLSSGKKTCSSVGRIGSVQRIVSTFGKPTATVVPKKHDTWLQEEIEKRKHKEAAALQKKEQLLKEKMEQSKRKNEEKQQKVLQKRQQMFKAKEERKRTIELKQEQHAARKFQLEEKRKEELEKKKKEEIIIKQKMQVLKAAAQQEEQLKQERLISTEQEIPISNAEKPVSKALANVHNQTFNAETSESSTYDITPHHSEVPPLKLMDPENYDINDLNSEDDTDDESAPRKQIPSWAQGTKLHLLLRRQNKSNFNVGDIFPELDIIKEFDLTKVFKIQRRRFYNRTSSAVWHLPPLPSQ